MKFHIYSYIFPSVTHTDNWCPKNVFIKVQEGLCKAHIKEENTKFIIYKLSAKKIGDFQKGGIGVYNKNRNS